MAINKVVYGANTLIDITDTTATPDKVLEGFTFYDAAGIRQAGIATVGAAVIVDSEDPAGGTIRTITTGSEVYLQGEKIVSPTRSTQTIVPDSGYTAFTSVTVEPIPPNYGLITWDGSALTIS